MSVFAERGPLNSEIDEYEGHPYTKRNKVEDVRSQLDAHTLDLNYGCELSSLERRLRFPCLASVRLKYAIDMCGMPG